MIPVVLDRERRGPGEGADSNGKENVAAQIALAGQRFGFWLLNLLFLWFPASSVECSWWVCISVSSAFGSSPVVERLSV